MKNQDVINGATSSLPATSFARFTAYRVKNAEVVWKNKQLIKEYGFVDKPDIDSWLLNEFAYSSLDPFYTDKASDQSIFFAERYGGQLIASNGGGGRAGLKGQFQCKGIGPTPLINQMGITQYSIGVATLKEMLNEALWGEVCHTLLPYGAVRCLAIIDLNHTNENNEKCAIAVRENELRLAHFELSPYFIPDNTSDFVSETHRAKLSIEAFPECFKSAFGSYPGFRSSMELILDRYAKQLAYARFFRICHGSLTSSNIGLTGKYLDFGTISSLGTYENIITSMGNIGFLKEEDNIFESIINFIDGYNWYSIYENENSTDYCVFFSRSLNKHLRQVFLTSIGLIKNKHFYEEKKSIETFELIYRYLTMGGNREVYGVTYHNKGSCYHKIESLFNILKNKPRKNGIEDRIFRLASELKISDSNFDEINLEKRCSLFLTGRFNLDFLHYDKIREDIDLILTLNDKNFHVNCYISEILSKTKQLRDFL
ncbi:conserved hypothetical protein [Vibrio crassostreae]|uniref:protein adenylyltransferase SelO family protein n=1 Tax=Vibrio crassostreae TaxID=246167 RepID=UPI0010481016|nr:protein adenylyltransferase SelO family protein [Vibrio crassostreae]TCN76906.1 YdiU/UPF0061 family uncharacterized protein [Vibrio crassostreae]CAK2509937.1 conserved hypothetical protein [Vibrio crassostreae]CAK2520617.1 conserved hypothetical protein [Vibrio crassostreae]CAK3859443.1 conserved hypothetical protein [Vibrio crassostreae]CAK4006427.1 conserved hypothetical protein [Vibrio crassostreae]